MDHFDTLILKLIISYFVRKETNIRNWPAVITPIIADYASSVLVSLYFPYILYFCL